MKNPSGRKPAKKKAQSVKQTAKRPAPRSAWKPGESGNPHGRPRTGNALAEVLRDYLNEPLAGTMSDRKRLLVHRLFQVATGKNVQVAAAKLLIEVAGAIDTDSRLSALETEISELRRERDEARRTTASRSP
jgi:hypothetical protein